MEFLLAVEAFDVGQLTPVEHAFAHDVDTEVRKPVGDDCIGHRHGGRAVEEYEVVRVAHFGDQFVEFFREQHLRGVGRLNAGVDHVEVLVESGVLDHALRVGDRSCEVSRDAGLAVSVSQQGRQRVAAQVEVDEQHAFAGHGERHRQVRRHEGLARVGVRRGEEDGAHVGSGRYAHEGHVRAQDAECFRQGVAARFAHHDSGLAVTLVVGDVAQERGVDVVLDVLASADGRVEHADQVEQAEGNGQTHDQGDAQNHHRSGRYGSVAAVGVVDRSRIALGHGVVELVLLLFVQQVEEQFFLDFLLTRDAQDDLLLRRHSRDAEVGLRLLLAHGVALDFERRDIGVERRDDRTPHGGQQVVEVLDDGAAVRTVLQQFLAAQDRRVVVFDLLGDGRVGSRGRHRRNQLPDVFRVVQVGADVLRHVDLVFERKTFRLVARTFRHAARGLRGDVHHPVILLDVLDVAVHVAQLASDNVQTGLDELARGDRHAALVLDGVFVVGFDQRVDHVLGAPGHGVVHRNGHHRGLLVGHVAFHGGAVGVGGPSQRTFAHADRYPDVVGGHVERLLHHDLPHGGRDRVSVSRRDDAAALVLGDELVFEPAQPDFVVVERRDLHGERLVVVVVDEFHVDRGLAVEVAPAEPFAHRVVDRQVELLDHVGHQAPRLEDENLVVDVAAVLESRQVAERRQVDVAALAAVLDHDGRRAAVNLRGAGQVVVGRAEAEYGRKHEPVPVCDHHADDVVQGDGPCEFFVVGLRLGIDMLFCHGYLLFGEGYDECRHRNRGSHQREVKAAVLADFARLRLVLVGFHVYHVVLLEVENRGVEDVGRREVEVFDRAHAVRFARHGHFRAHAVHGHVAGHRQRVEYRDLVARDVVESGTGHLADHRNLHVGELHVDRGVVDVSALDDFFGDGLGQFAAGLALAFDLADHGHVEHPFLVDGAHLERLRACCAGDVGSRERVVGGCRVERHCQFGVLAVDDDRQPVERLDADLSVFGDLFGCEGLGVLQIPYALLCGARNEQYAEDRCPDEKAELLHF